MICAIIAAGGSGSRMQMSGKKQYLALAGVPVLARTLMAFDAYPKMEKIIVVIPEEDKNDVTENVLGPFSWRHHIQVVAGGKRRQESVANGLQVLGASDGIVMIHDGVRPFISTSLMDACIAGVKTTGACIPVLPATDTLKRVDRQGMVVETLDRRRIYTAQTPQTFSIPLIRKAHRLAIEKGFFATDDASMVEFAGGRVATVIGDKINIKITTPDDLIFARALAESNMDD